MPDTHRFHPAALAALACFQNASVGGLLYGWASIDRTLLAANPTDGGAGLSPAQSTAIFSWASSAAMLAALVLGVVLDKWGPRACSVVSHVCIAWGCLLFAAATNFGMFAVAACLLGFGGPGIQISVVHIANLFQKNQFTVLAVLNGIMTMSFAVFAMFDWIWRMHLSTSFRVLFGSYTVVVTVSTVFSVYCWPDTAFEAPSERSIKRSYSQRTMEDDYFEAQTAHTHLLEQPINSFLRSNQTHELDRHDSFILSEKALAVGNESLVDLKDQTFWRQLTSGVYFRALLILVRPVFSSTTRLYVVSISVYWIV